MTDTDKLKRLAEAALKVGGGWECSTEEGSDFIAAANPQAILALIAENEERKRECEAVQVLIDKAIAASIERDEAVALLREAASELESEVEARYDGIKDHPAMTPKYERDMDTPLRIRAFLARIDGGEG